jgi:hypothetical protein
MIKDKIIEILEEAKLSIIENIDKQGIKASGRTQKALHVVSNENHIMLINNGTGAPFTTLQYGRGAGKVPKNMNDILVQWMKDKGIQVEPIPYKTERPHKYTPIERGYMQRAYFISQKIQEEGTNRHKAPNENVYTKPIEVAIAKITKLLVTEVKTIIKQE